MAGFDLNIDFDSLIKEIENEPNILQEMFGVDELNPNDPVSNNRFLMVSERLINEYVKAGIRFTLWMTEAADHGNIRMQKDLNKNIISFLGKLQRTLLGDR